MNFSKILIFGILFLILSFIPPSFALNTLPEETNSKISDSADLDSLDFLEKNAYLSRPTFGLDHYKNQKLVDYGFKLNEKNFTISDNFHTPFVEQIINIGETNTFETKVFSEKGLRVQEFLFGIPEVGEAQNAELGIEVWLNHLGIIEKVIAVQKTEIVDPNNIHVTHEKAKCLSNSVEKNCDSVRISLIFMEPLRDKVMAIKAIDQKNRYQITYLNDGINLTGQTLNPMKTTIISSNTKNEGPIEVTQLEKYSTFWESTDGRVFERNSFGSFKEIINSFERHADSGEPRTRTHSEFRKLIENEKYRAYNIFNSTVYESQLPKPFSYIYPEEKERIDPLMEAKMKAQEVIAQKLIENSQVQARFSNINS
ncbi:MAG: hypothetical protein R3237_01920 [Nitrosopumilaceae archaeon]|nr:hypothetical protein [Nitrosopumilaceae archaeon]